MVFLFLLWPQGIPPFAENLGNSSIVLIGMALVYQGSVSLAEDHESIHGPPNVVFLFGLQHNINGKNSLDSWRPV